MVDPSGYSFVRSRRKQVVALDLLRLPFGDDRVDGVEELLDSALASEIRRRGNPEREVRREARGVEALRDGLAGVPDGGLLVSDVHVEQRLGQDVEREPLQPVVDADRLAGWKPVGEPAGVLAHHRRVGLDTLPVERGLDEVPVALPLLAAGRDEPRQGDRADGLLDDGPLDELAVALDEDGLDVVGVGEHVAVRAGDAVVDDVAVELLATALVEGKGVADELEGVARQRHPVRTRRLLPGPPSPSLDLAVAVAGSHRSTVVAPVTSPFPAGECKLLSVLSRSPGMDEFAADTKVEWREGGAAAFEDAAEAGKPLLLALTVPWSSECREMDRRTYGEPASPPTSTTASSRSGSTPTATRASANDTTWAGSRRRCFSRPREGTLRGDLPRPGRLPGHPRRRARDVGREGEAAGSVPWSVGARRPAGWRSHPAHRGAHGRTAIGRLRRGVRRLGSDVKFPMARTVEFALVRARDQATRTLEAIRTHLRDTYDGGFYRFATNRDWSEARSEKLLDENAAILRAFAHAYRYTGEEAYRETAEGTVEYLTTTLWDGEAEAFAGSQAGDSSYVTLQATEREDADAPHVDDTVFADRNGVAVDALCTYAAYTDDEHARRYAARARDHVVEQLRRRRRRRDPLRRPGRG